MLFSLNEFPEPDDNLHRPHRAVVVENRDPKRIGRVQVYIPGIVEAEEKASFLWARPLLPAHLGASPDSTVFSVPEVGSEVEVTFFGGNLYDPVYIGTGASENHHWKEVFGKSYPHSYGRLDSSGTVERTDKRTHEFDCYRGSGAYLRGTRHRIEVNVPGDLFIKVDGDYRLQERYWETGGGGLGEFFEEMACAVLDGPEIQGVMDLVSVLDGPGRMDLHAFYAAARKLQAARNILASSDPDLPLAVVESVLRTLFPDAERHRLQHTFTVLNGASGLRDLFRRALGMNGEKAGDDLDGVEPDVDGFVNALGEPALLRIRFKGERNDPLSKEETAERFAKLDRGLSALADALDKLRAFEELRQFLNDWRNEWDPSLILRSLPQDLRKKMFDLVRERVSAVLQATAGIDPRSRIVYLGRLQFNRLVSSVRGGVQARQLKEITEALLAAGVNPYHLGMSGHVVRDALLRGVEFFDIVEVAQAYLGAGGYPDRCMTFLDELAIDVPDATTGYFVSDRFGSIHDGEDEARRKKEAVADKGPVEYPFPSFSSETVRNLLERTGLDPAKVSYGGAAIGSVARTGLPVDEVRVWFQELSGWFGTQPSENVVARAFNRFVAGLNLPVLFLHKVSFDAVRSFVSGVLMAGDPLGIAPYGANVHEILDSGFVEEAAPFIREAIEIANRLKSERRDHAYAYPDALMYASVFGSPRISVGPGMDAVQKKVREMETLSRRMMRLGQVFREANARTVNALLKDPDA